MENPILTIAIPTYDRPAQIIKRVEELLPQLTVDTELLILDNASPEIVKNLIEAHFDLPEGRIRFVRNKFNIGGGGNICRCFETASTSWLWLLGDDDIVEPEAIKNILAEIELQGKEPLIAGFTCSTEIYKNTEPEMISSLADLCRHLENPIKFSNALYISAQVYHLESVRAFLRHGYQHISSCGPHLVMVMHAMSSGKKWKLVSFPSVRDEINEGVPVWNVISVSMGPPLLLEAVANTSLLMKSFKLGLPYHLGDLTWKRGIRNILLGNDRDLGFWEIYYLRSAPLMTGFNYTRSFTLSVLARFFSQNPAISKGLRKFFSKFAKAPQTNISENNRL